MKTKEIGIKVALTLITIVSMASCNTYYRMVTTLDSDGNAYREVYAQGDSAFMAGDGTKNPYFFDITPDWTLERLDSPVKYDFFGEAKSLNVKLVKETTSIDLFSKEISSQQETRSFASPQESITKRFRWFYTVHSFEGLYKRLDYNAPVPIDNYLSEQEKNLWTRGCFDAYGAMNGSEMNELLGDIEGKFMNWYSRNCFEISLGAIEKLLEKGIEDRERDAIYKFINDKDNDITPDVLSKNMDAFYKTTRYSELYKANKDLLDEEFERESWVIYVIGNLISYELIVPGEVINTNAPIVNGETLIWKIDGMRILFDDYIITAQYRTLNLWFCILSGLIVIIAVVSGVVRRRRIK